MTLVDLEEALAVCPCGDRLPAVQFYARSRWGVFVSRTACELPLHQACSYTWVARKAEKAPTRAVITHPAVRAPRKEESPADAYSRGFQDGRAAMGNGKGW